MITDYYIGPDCEALMRPHFWSMWSLFQDDGFVNYYVRPQSLSVFAICFLYEGVPE